MDILQPRARHELFYSYGPVYTKMTDEIPARYGNSAYGSHSLIADGCIIEGQVENCILFRGVTIGKGAVVKNSILMNNTKVGENAILNYIITDKQVHLSEGRTLVGCIEQPAYVRKGSRI